MAKALQAGPVARHRRAFFGLLDADGWGWASLKAFFWFILIIFLIGYIPDRAYYFTVNRTIDLGILAWSPINLCPPENGDLPCPAPQGAVLRWETSPTSPVDISLPAPRTDGALVQAGRQLLYIGGSDGTAASNAVYVARTSGTGNFDAWTVGPSLPAPRSSAAVASLGGSIYVIGGLDASGQPTTTTLVLSPNSQTGDLGTWKTAANATDADVAKPIDLPEPRAGASLVALGDGLLLVGGAGPDGAPTNTTWKSQLDRTAKLGAWTPQAPLTEAVADAIAVQNGDYIWVYGGRNATGPTATVQRGDVSTTAGDTLGDVTGWATNPAANLPEPRTNATGWAANGALYLVGGNDGTRDRRELYWTVPQAGAPGQGDTFAEWRHLAESDLPAPGREGGSSAILGPNAIIVGGTSAGAVQANALRTNMAPQEPFFQLGLVGATVPALQIEGEIGQQLGYLSAAGAATVNFIILVLIGWAFAHREQARGLFERLRARRRGR
ncbi:MAG: kelch repeat-containing protein [Chloroflexota bacterium]